MPIVLRSALQSIWVAILLAAAVIIPRSALVCHAHSDSMDDEYHLSRGVRFWTGQLGGVRMNDPPLGEAIKAVPLVLAGVRAENNKSILYDQPRRPETLLMLVAVWSAILFLPMLAVIFAWIKELYGIGSAWLAIGVFTFEPNFAAHISVGAIDVLGVEGIVLACWLAWRYSRRPTLARLSLLCIACAAALLIKHTAIILPAVIVLLLLFSLRQSKARPNWKLGLLHLVFACGILLLSMWAFTLFDISHPNIPKSARVAAISPHLPEYLPAGVYVGSVFNGLSHAERGHAGYLFGQKRMTGWWYYFPVVAAYKVPIAVGILIALSIASLLFVKPRWNEWTLLIPAVAWTALMMHSTVNIGFRHFLPPYAFLLMLATRCAATSDAGIRFPIASFAALALLIADSLWHSPNYISYFNFPRHKPYLAINDSNVDWGQSLKQVRDWIDSHPQQKPIYLRYFGRFDSPNIRYYLGDRVRVLEMDNRPPRGGILIISPFWEAGVWDDADRYRPLRSAKPIATIGDCMLVYDLDKIKGWKTFVPKRAAAATSAPSPDAL